MKYFYSLVFILATCINSNSQAVFGLEAGSNISTLNFKKDYAFTPVNAIGFRAGFNYLYKISETFDIETGIFFYQKGQRYKYVYDNTNDFLIYGNGSLSNPGIATSNELYRLNYLELPVSINLNYESFFISAGLYYSYGFECYFYDEYEYYDKIAKQVVTKSTTTHNLFDNGIQNGRIITTKKAKRPDYGITLGLGYRTGRLELKSVFDFGLPYVITSAIPDFFFYTYSENYRNTSLSISVVYYISKNFLKRGLKRKLKILKMNIFSHKLVYRICNI
jgi:hypothetical protein